MGHRREPVAFAFGDWIGGVMRNHKVLLLGILLLLGGGCMRRAERASLPNLLVPVGCASEIMLMGCDARVSPPKCKTARVRYRKGCEEIVVGREHSAANE